MKAAHTPGPWHVERACGRYEIWPKDQGQTHSYIGTIQEEANARLIAAAPELLELLIDIGQWLEAGLTRGQISRATVNRDGDLVTQIRAVIAKAKGGAQ